MKTYPFLLEAMANVLETLRKERHLTKTTLATYADLQDCYVRGITKGKRNPSVTSIYGICEALNIPIWEFFRKVEEERSLLMNNEEGKKR